MSIAIDSNRTRENKSDSVEFFSRENLVLLSLVLSTLIWLGSSRIFAVLNTLHEQLGYACEGELHHRASRTRDMGDRKSVV